MDAFISLVATRADGKKVYSIGRRSRYVQFPVTKLYEIFNEAEGLDPRTGWGGSDIIGGSPRALGSYLTWEMLKNLTLSAIEK